MSHSRSLIVGTAGHIDHGKSTLVKALTGIDPDRLAEEKKRGITIELGFGEIVSPEGHHFGVVDVPGHEKFVRHMVAGATGIDIALIVIAADDGVMVQTREHLAILELLGIQTALVALTKIDKSEPELTALVKADIEQTLADTPYAGAPIMGVSAVTGEGIEGLLGALDDLANNIEASTKKKGAQALRLPVDRVFTIEGAGTVITGSLWEGSVALGDEAEAVFAQKKLRARSIEVHDRTVEKAVSGQRVALNLAGAAKGEIKRGEMLCTPGLLEPTTRFNVEFIYSGSAQFGGSVKPFKSGSKVHIHHATRTTIAQIFLFDDKAIEPGQKVFAQIRTDEPLAILARDRFIVRSYSPVLTIGGGQVLLTHAPKRLKISEDERVILDAQARSDMSAALLALLAVHSEPLSSDAIARILQFPRQDIAARLNQSTAARLKVQNTTYYIEQKNMKRFAEKIETTLETLHEKRVKQHSFTLSELSDAMHVRCDEHIFEGWIEAALATIDGVIYENGRLASAQSFHAHSEASTEIARLALEELTRARLSVPTRDELAQSIGADVDSLQKVLNEQCAQGEVIRLAQKFYFTHAAIDEARELLVNALKNSTPESPVTAAELRSVLGVSRKYAIPLLEYFDAQGLTRRAGEGRYLV